MRLFLAVILMCLALPAWAETRLALVIGNSGYSTIQPLDNPSRDAALMAETLDELGFEVTALIDAGQAEMMLGIAAFGRSLRDAGADATGLFYYAGHGVQSFGSNYLLPVDIALADAADLDLVAVEAQAVLRQMFSARNRTNIVILDACRNNPFDNIPAFDSNGLAEMKAPTGTYLVYATEPGGVALDGEGGNSPFTEALARHMTEPGAPIEQVFKRVRNDVLAASGGRQTPWDTSSLTVEFTFAEAAPVSAEDLEELQLWQSVQATGDPVQVMLFLRAYPGSRFEDEARALLATAMERELAGEAAPAAAPEGPAEDEQAAFEAAQADGSVAAYEAFLAAFPESTFAEFVAGEIASLRADTATDPVGEGVTPDPEPAPEPEAPVAEIEGDVTFEGVLAQGGEGVAGRSIAEIIAGSPLYPPIEGLPEEIWKDQTCANCHDWQKDNLCTQAQVYLSASAERSLSKEHPMGGGLKEALRRWAGNDCR